MKDLIEALKIFLKYSDTEWPTNCTHDVLFVDVNPRKVSLSDHRKLRKLDFYIDKEQEGFISYRFGSC